MKRLTLVLSMILAACADRPAAAPANVACTVPAAAPPVAHTATAARRARAAAPAPSAAPAPAAPVPATSTPPDNTGTNVRDRASGAVTPMNQGNGEDDLKTTQHIRQAVMADGSLSFTAKNVKIITQNGKVTLRGPVNSADERKAIEAAAKKVAGDSQVDDQLEVTK